MPAYRNMKPLRLLVLLGIGVVLVATLMSFLKRWKGAWPGGNAPQAVVEPLREEVDQQTRAFSLSKTEGSHTLYTIRAEQVTTLKQTQKNLLHGVVVDIFGKTGQRHDRIATAECEYDPAMQTLWVPGEVEMDFALPAGNAPEGPEQRVVIHTAQLHFDQSSGVASTEASVAFSFPQGEGRSRGARYDPGTQTLQLVSGVEFRLAPPAGQSSPPITVHAGGLVYQRGEALITLSGNVEIVKAGQRLRADAGSVWLDEANQVRRAELNGDVRGADASAAFAANVRSGRALLNFTSAGSVDTVELLEGVRWQTAGAGSPGAVAAAAPQREGSSERMLINFAVAPAGAGGGAMPDRATAAGNVKITLRSASQNADRNGRPGAEKQKAESPAGRMQVLTGQQAQMLFAPGGRLLRDATLSGAPRIELYGEPGAAPRTITAGNFDFDFTSAGELEQFKARDNVRVNSPVPATPARPADTRITTSRELNALLDPATGQVSTLRQSGDFAYQDSTRRAQAASAQYQAAGELLILDRQTAAQPGAKRLPQPFISQSEGRIAADRISLYTGSGNVEAAGAVATTSTTGASASGGAASSEPLHAVADQLSYDGGTQVAHYSGHTRLWQGTGFLLEAEAATVDRRQKQLTANGKVLTIFRPETSPARPAGREPPGTYTVRSASVAYFQAGNRILYEGGVQASQQGGTLTAKTLEITLKSGEKNAAADLQSTASQVEKMVARGGVEMRETGRVGNGDTAEYIAENKTVNLYGRPAILSDSARGVTKGVQLSYQIGDNSATVVGEGGERSETRWIPTR